MKFIVYEPDPLKAERLAHTLSYDGHQTVARAETIQQLEHLMGEFDAHCLVVGQVSHNQPCPLATGACAESLYGLMTAEGYRVITPPRIWEAALPLCAPCGAREQIIARAAGAFRRFMVAEPVGLTLLPLSSLAGLPGILRRLARPFRGSEIPCFPAGVAVKHGMLEIEFHQDAQLPPPLAGSRSLRLELRKALNLAVYPSIWRPLKRRHHPHQARGQSRLRRELV
jgi:hypothetical protein